MITIYKKQFLILFVTCFASGMGLQKQLLIKNDKISWIKLKDDGKRKIESFLETEYELIKDQHDLSVISTALKTEKKLDQATARIFFRKCKVKNSNGEYEDKLIKVDISHRSLSCQEDIEKAALCGSYKPTQVVEINASFNKLKSINVSQLRGVFHNLEEIDLSYNRIKNVTCSGTLSARGNSFSRIELITYFMRLFGSSYFSYSSYFTSTRLEMLNLSHNYIKVFDANQIPVYNLDINLSDNLLSPEQQEFIKKKLNLVIEGRSVKQNLYYNMLCLKYGGTLQQGKLDEYNNDAGHHGNKFSTVILDNQLPDLMLNRLKDCQRTLIFSDL